MAQVTLKAAHIAGIATAVPARRFDNMKDPTAFPPVEVQKVTRMAGVAARHLADETTCSSDLCGAAARRLLSEIGWEAGSIDALIFVTQTPDYLLPSRACIMQSQTSPQPASVQTPNTSPDTAPAPSRGSPSHNSRPAHGSGEPDRRPPFRVIMGQAPPEQIDGTPEASREDRALPVRTRGVGALSASLPGPHIDRITQTQLLRPLTQPHPPALIRTQTPKGSLSFVRIVKCPPPMASPSKNVRDDITLNQDISNK